jgi:hypothetical protein
MRREARTRSRRAGLLPALVALAVIGRARPAAADDVAALGGEKGASQHEIATIVLVGTVGNDGELALLLRELLGRRGVEVVLSTVARFEPDALFAADQAAGLRVFVVQRGPRDARLYFRAEAGERYLLRRLALPTGLDAVGRELIGQVVESSAEALLDASQGVTREEVTREIEGDDATAKEPARAEPLPPPARKAPTAPRRSSFEPRLSARYAGFWQGSELGARHGPGLGIGIRYDAGVLLGLELGGELFFEQSLSHPDLEGQVHGSDVFLNGEVGLVLGGGHRLLVALGPRLEPLTVRTEARNASVTAAETRRRVDAGLRVELRYEWAGAHVAVGIAIAADVAFARTRYELALPDGATQTLAEIPSFRPGFAVTLALHR